MGMGGGGGMDGPLSGSAPPAPQGLGNFKGVMLCNRPTEPGQPANSGEGDGALPPFRSRVSAQHGERLGLNPCAKAVIAPSKKYRNESLERHGKWLKKLQKGISEDQQKAQDGEAETQRKEALIKESSAKYREDVRKMLTERNKQFAEDMEAHKYANRVARGLVPPPGGPGGKSSNKPLWAMTESEVAEFDRGEAEDLINFAEGLDYDQFINDLEFKEALCLMKDRVGVLKREQEEFKRGLVDEFNRAAEQRSDGGESVDLVAELGESASQVGSEAQGRRKANRGGGNGLGEDRPDWDATSSVGESVTASQRDKAEMAKGILAANAQMRNVHSKESVQRILEKQNPQEGG